MCVCYAITRLQVKEVIQSRIGKTILAYILTILTNVLLRILSSLSAYLNDKSCINTVSCFTYSTTNSTPSTSPCFGEEPATQSQF